MKIWWVPKTIMLLIILTYLPEYVTTVHHQKWDMKKWQERNDSRLFPSPGSPWGVKIFSFPVSEKERHWTGAGTILYCKGDFYIWKGNGYSPPSHFFKKGIRTEINAVFLFSETKVGVIVSRERITRTESPLASFYGQENRGTERLHDFHGYGRIEPKLSSRPPEILCPLLLLLHIFLFIYTYFFPQWSPFSLH